MNHSHQVRLFDPQTARTVTLIGAGSVGSWTACLLAKMGVTDIRVYDADDVASHNVPMSLYGINDIGKLKVDALQERILRDTGVTLRTFSRMYDGEALTNTSVIACVDTMDARRTIWSQVKDRATIGLFCDTRVNGAFIDVLALEPANLADQARCEALDFPDEEAEPQFCGRHGIGYAASRAAGIVVSNLAAFWGGTTFPWRVIERCDTLLRVH